MSGTINNPYLIYTAEDFNNIRNNIGSSTNHVYYKLMNDIDLLWVDWNPIGNIENPARVSIDGNNKKIKRLNIYSPITSYNGDVSLYGIFGCIELNNAEYLIKDLFIESSSINIQSNNSYFLHAGLIAGIVYDNASNYNSNYNNLKSFSNIKIIKNNINISNISSSILSVGGFVSYASSSYFYSCSLRDNEFNITQLNNDLISLKISGIASYVNAIGFSFVKNNIFNIDINKNVLDSEINCFSTNATYFIFKNNYSLNNIINSNIDNANSVVSGIDSSAELLYHNSITNPNFAYNYALNEFNTSAKKIDSINFENIDSNSDIQNNYYSTYIYNLFNDYNLYFEHLSIEQLRNKIYFTNWDFNNIWGSFPHYQNGHPYLLYENVTYDIQILKPKYKEVYKPNSKLVIEWDVNTSN